MKLLFCRFICFTIAFIFLVSTPNTSIAESAESHLIYAIDLLELSSANTDDFEEALAEVDRAINIDPYYADAYLLRAIIDLLIGNDQEDVLTDLSKAINTFEEQGMDTGPALIVKHFVTAATILSSIEGGDINPEKSKEALIEINKAIDGLNKEIEVNSKDPKIYLVARVYLVRAMINMKLEGLDSESVQSDIDKSIELADMYGTSNNNALALKGITSRSKGDNAEAKVYLGESEELGNEDAGFLQNMTNCESDGNAKQCIGSILKAMERNGVLSLPDEFTSPEQQELLDLEGQNKIRQLKEEGTDAAIKEINMNIDKATKEETTTEAIKTFNKAKNSMNETINSTMNELIGRETNIGIKKILNKRKNSMLQAVNKGMNKDTYIKMTIDSKKMNNKAMKDLSEAINKQKNIDLEKPFNDERTELKESTKKICASEDKGACLEILVTRCIMFKDSEACSEMIQTIQN